LEASVFGGAEPEDPYDFGNIDSFGDSWSIRMSRRWPEGPLSAWELSVSHANVAESHGLETIRTRLWNGAIRYEMPGPLRYALLEASTAEAPGVEDLFSVLGEARFVAGRHQPYARIEVATRPEYERLPGPDGFFRYDHDAGPIGTTRWLITTLAYEYVVTESSVALWPFVEVQHARIREDHGSIDPGVLYGTDSVLSLTLGVRVLLGGDPMRMGLYGVRDPMATMPGMGSGMEAM
jgi:hypothetical protein